MLTQQSSTSHFGCGEALASALETSLLPLQRPLLPKKTCRESGFYTFTESVHLLSTNTQDATYSARTREKRFMHSYSQIMNFDSTILLSCLSDSFPCFSIDDVTTPCKFSQELKGDGYICNCWRAVIASCTFSHAAINSEKPMLRS